MSSQPLSVKQIWVAQQQQAGIAVSDELLQKSEDPIADLKGQPDRIAVVVPYEYLWPEALKPGTNPTHKRMYDADLLSEHLETAGYHSHVLRVIDFQGWTWLSAIGVRILNSAQRRKLKRHPVGTETNNVVVSVRSDETVAGKLPSEDRHDDRSVQAGDSADKDGEPTRASS